MLARPASAKQIKRVTSLFGEFCKICYFRTGRELSRVSFRKDFWDSRQGLIDDWRAPSNDRRKNSGHISAQAFSFSLLLK